MTHYYTMHKIHIIIVPAAGADSFLSLSWEMESACLDDDGEMIMKRKASDKLQLIWFK